MRGLRQSGRRREPVQGMRQGLGETPRMAPEGRHASLQQIAYKQATTRERSPRHGNRAYAAPPVNEAAQALYSAVETHLQLTGGMLGVKPIGHDRYDRPRTLMQWADITRLLLHHMPDLARLDTAGDLYADLIRLSEKVETATTHAASAVLSAYAPTA